MRKIIACLLAVAVCGLGSLFAADEDFNAHTEAAVIALQRFYSPGGLWKTTGWWNAANCVEALENVIQADNGRNYLPVLAKTFKLNSGTNFLNEYYDDEGWWALAWIRAFDLTGNTNYLKAAKTIFNDLTNGWTAHCEGGLIWRKRHGNKNAIPNELFLVVASRLHQRTPGDGGEGSYLAWALREWEWFKQTGMINSENMVNDGLTRNCRNDGRTTWTYNQGVIIGGLTDLYKCTGDSNYLNQAIAIANAAIGKLVDERGVLHEPCEYGDCKGGDTPQFKGIFIRYLAYLYDETHNPAYLEFLRKNASSVWANDRDEADNLGLRWSGPFDFADAARHSSAMMAVSALAEPMTKELPLCKGAGSASFNHAVGAASVDLAWTCAAVDTNAGLMLSGACASLGVGKHIAHFRFAVSEIKNSAAKLARLEIKTKDTTLATLELSPRSFGTANQYQDFQLAFTNSTAGTPLQFQAYWCATPDAPNLTLSDVTIDGGHNWAAANLGHEIGRLDGLNGWEADPIRDKHSGFLVNGPGATEFTTGKYSALFELKVDNFNWDKSTVATLSVVDVAANKILATREVQRDQFPDTLYHAFALEFKAGEGKRYDFRTFWHYAANAPRLTQRSVVVQRGAAGAASAAR